MWPLYTIKQNIITSIFMKIFMTNFKKIAIIKGPDSKNV